MFRRRKLNYRIKSIQERVLGLAYNYIILLWMYLVKDKANSTDLCSRIYYSKLEKWLAKS